jgi:hypothetical protein
MLGLGNISPCQQRPTISGAGNQLAVGAWMQIWCRLGWVIYEGSTWRGYFPSELRIILPGGLGCQGLLEMVAFGPSSFQDWLVQGPYMGL